MPDPSAPAAPRYLRSPEAARHLGLSAATLAKHRCYGTGPRFHKLGGRVVYAAADLDDWANTGRRKSNADRGAGFIPPIHKARR